LSDATTILSCSSWLLCSPSDGTCNTTCGGASQPCCGSNSPTGRVSRRPVLEAEPATATERAPLEPALATWDTRTRPRAVTRVRSDIPATRTASSIRAMA
jgi:hypothetical protein